MKRFYALLFALALAVLLPLTSRRAEEKIQLPPPPPLPAYEAEWPLAPADLPQDKQMRLVLDCYLYPAGAMKIHAQWRNTSLRMGQFDSDFTLQKWDGQAWRETSLPFDYQPPIFLNGYGMLPLTFRRCAYSLAGKILETTPGRYRIVVQDTFRNCQAQAEFWVYPMEKEKLRRIQAEQQRKAAQKQIRRLTWPKVGTARRP